MLSPHLLTLLKNSCLLKATPLWCCRGTLSQAPFAVLGCSWTPKSLGLDRDLRGLKWKLRLTRMQAWVHHAWPTQSLHGLATTMRWLLIYTKCLRPNSWKRCESIYLVVNCFGSRQLPDNRNRQCLSKHQSFPKHPKRRSRIQSWRRGSVRPSMNFQTGLPRRREAHWPHKKFLLISDRDCFELDNPTKAPAAPIERSMPLKTTDLYRIHHHKSC